jgi:hypothetical protein
MLPVHEGLTLERVRVDIDRAQYVDCTFRRCEIVYHGGAFHFPGCSFDQCGWTFVDEAERTMQLLALLCRSDPGLARMFGTQFGLIKEYAH